jgi:hypothetical protein
MTVVSWLGSLHTATSGLELSSFEMIVLGSPFVAEAIASDDLADNFAASCVIVCASRIATCVTSFPAPTMLRANGVVMTTVSIAAAAIANAIATPVPNRSRRVSSQHCERKTVERRSGRRVTQQAAYLGIAGQRLFTACADCEMAGDLLHLMRG